MDHPREDEREKLRSTTMLGCSLSVFGAAMVVLSLLAVLLLRTCCDDPGISMSVLLNIAARAALLFTGVAVLRRTRHAALVAAITLGISFVALSFDVVKYLGTPNPPDVPTDIYQSGAIGASIGFLLILALTILTLLYLRRSKVRHEFGAKPSVQPTPPSDRDLR
jgi:hypothetical protein